MKKTVKVKTLVIALASAGLASIPGYSLANPTGGQVVAGNATIRQESATKVGITQTTDRAIIDWQKFSIGANEHVQYYQPSAASVTLNRVVGQDPSQILGRLTANGQVFLVNPNGIYFGKNAQIDVAGLVASTHNIRNEDFMAGKYLFNIPGKPGASVINEGQIRIADTGIAAFVAPSVANRGVIAAKLGKVALASANGFTLDFHGDELLTFMVGDEVAKTAFDLEGNQLTSFVENSGKIQASGGYVLLTAKAAENAIHNVINQSGLIEASSVGQQNGEIILSGGQHGVISNTGALDASGKAAGQTGGKVQITGEKIGLFAGTLIDVSGDQGGGKAIVGGDYLGGQASDALMAELGIQRESKPIQTATFTNMAKEAVINADALTAGKGGKVVLWSDNTTRAFGTVTSRGYGNGLGGFIEVSGKNALDIFGLQLSAGSENAQGGTILFDPVSVNIVDHNQAQTGINVSNFSASNSTDISSQAIQDILNTGSNVTIRTNNTGGQGDIHVKSNILKTAGGDATLSLLANSAIYVNYGKTIQSLKGKLNVIMDSDTDNILGGVIQIRKTSGSDEYAIATNGGNVVLRAWDTILDGRAIQTLGGDVTIRRINDSATWVTIGPSGSNYYTLDAYTGKLTIDIKYNSSATDDGDFVEFHNHAVRAMSMDINSSSVRNHSSGYSYGNSHYSYTLPAYDARDHEAEIAYQAGKVTMRGGATLSALDGKIEDPTFVRQELLEKYQDVAKKHDDYLAKISSGLGSNTNIIHYSNSAMADIFLGETRAFFNDNGDLEFKNDRKEAITAYITDSTGKVISTVLIPGKVDSDFGVAVDTVFHYGAGLLESIDNLNDGMSASAISVGTKINVKNLPPGTSIRYVSGTPSANAMTLISSAVTAFASTNKIVESGAPVDISKLIKTTFIQEALKDPELISKTASLLASKPLPSATEIAKSTLSNYWSYVEKNYTKLLAKVVTEAAKEGLVSTTVKHAMVPLEEMRIFFTAFAGAEGLANSVATANTAIARIKNGGGKISTDLIGNDKGASYSPY